MSWGEEKTELTRVPKKSMVEEMKKILFQDPMVLPDFIPNCTMLYGYDNTAKTGLALEYLTPADIKDGKKVVVVDLDLGSLPLLMKFHKQKVLDGNIIMHDPMRWTEDEKGKPVVNYEETIDVINAIGVAVKESWKEENIKAIIFDGGSKLLKYSEQQMRIEKAITPDGGVSTRYWIVRNKFFMEALELYKSIPIHKIFIFHEDFIPGRQEPGKEIAAVKLHTNQMMFQKVLCERIDRGATVDFKATMHKVKGETAKEGKIITFLTVNKETEKVLWQPEKVIEVINTTEE